MSQSHRFDSIQLKLSLMHIFFKIDDKGKVRHFNLKEAEDGLFCVKEGDKPMELETLLEPYELGTRLYPTATE